MEDGARLTPAEYLDRAFDVIREEARANPSFAARLVKALGGEVVFEAGDRAALLNPLEIARRNGGDALRTEIAPMDAKALRSVLKAHGLATPVDVRGKTGEELRDMLVSRVLERLAARAS